MARKVLLVVVIAVLVAPAAAFAHIERASYWPDPAPDCSITPCAGGAVPKTRTLKSSLDRKAVGDTRVVCQPNSMALLRRSIRSAVKNGYDIRPTDHRTFSKRAGKRLLRTNRKLRKRCRFQSIQDAVTASHNNDRVVVMPGVYTEPKSRAAKTNDPACAQYKITNDKGSSGSVSYEYQFKCPNDQNLIAVLGREVGSTPPPQPPREDRHDIPDAGPCIRCNLQLEGSGVGADDVIIDAGRVASGDKGPRESVKDVGIRVDRADGFVLRNLKVRHAREHDIYVLEADGYRLDRFKTFWGGEYGVLTFVEDHGLMQNCEAAGSGDSGLYPGAGADTGVQREASEPVFRYSQRITRCDSHHNSGGYSGTDGNATHIDHNNFYDNALGFTTDVFTAPGHPGFPQDSDLVEYNNFYDNNYNPYADQGKADDIQPSVPVPVGTGMWIAGGNDNVVRYNRFYDNYRRGAMLFAAPDATVCGPQGKPVTGCDPGKVSTSYRNQFYGNVMGIAPDGSRAANGQDFWWDSFPGTTGNCWYDNQTADGVKLVTSPASLPACSGGKNPGESIGMGSDNEAELLGCFGAVSSHDYTQPTCPWFTTPAKPGSRRAALVDRARTARWARFLARPEVQSQVCRLYRFRPERCAGL